MSSSSSSQIELSPPLFFTPSKHQTLLPAFASLHISCITSPPNPILTFLPPVTPAKTKEIEGWWQSRFIEVLEGTRHILFVATLPKEGEETRIAGVCMLSTPKSETGPHRGFVEKFMVDPEFRGRGVGTGIMKMMEVVALERGAWLLVGLLLFGVVLLLFVWFADTYFKMLDTDVGSLGEGIYRRMGYIECGRIPEYDVWSKTGELKTEVFFYKKLTQSEEGKESSVKEEKKEDVNELN